MSDVVLFFKNSKEIRSWFQKNHQKLDHQWIGFYKKKGAPVPYTGEEVYNQAICFGWTGITMRSIDYFTYQVKYAKRKPGSQWSHSVAKRYQSLEKKKLVSAFGKKMYDSRKKTKAQERPDQATFTPAQLKVFKKNKAAWEFFEKQSPGYKKYMMYWVNSAKQIETKTKRFAELLKDSGNQSKLSSVVKAQAKMAENLKKRYPPGQTPIEEAKNLGLATGAELRSLGLDTVEKLKRMGWERALELWTQHFPQRLHLMGFYAIIGAVEEQSARKLDPDLKAEARALLRSLKSGF